DVEEQRVDHAVGGGAPHSAGDGLPGLPRRSPPREPVIERARAHACWNRRIPRPAGPRDPFALRTASNCPASAAERGHALAGVLRHALGLVRDLRADDRGPLGNVVPELRGLLGRLVEDDRRALLEPRHGTGGVLLPRRAALRGPPLQLLAALAGLLLQLDAAARGLLLQLHATLLGQLPQLRRALLGLPTRLGRPLRPVLRTLGRLGRQRGTRTRREADQACGHTAHRRGG